MDRRRVLTLTGASVATLLAGCTDEGGGGGGGDATSSPTDPATGADNQTPTHNSTKTDEPTPTPSNNDGGDSDGSAPEGTASSKAEGLRITDHKMVSEAGDNAGLATINGVVVNTNNEPVDYVEVLGTAYGEYEESYYDYTEYLAGGSEWEFSVELSSYYENIERYEVTVDDEPMYGAN